MLNVRRSAPRSGLLPANSAPHFFDAIALPPAARAETVPGPHANGEDALPAILHFTVADEMEPDGLATGVCFQTFSVLIH